MTVCDYHVIWCCYKGIGFNHLFIIVIMTYVSEAFIVWCSFMIFCHFRCVIDINYVHPLSRVGSFISFKYNLRPSSFVSWFFYTLCNVQLLSCYEVVSLRVSQPSRSLIGCYMSLIIFKQGKLAIDPYSSSY